MMYECLTRSDRFRIDYIELDEGRRHVSAAYDFYSFNYHHETMGWLDLDSLRKLKAPRIAFVLEVAPNDPFVLCPQDEIGRAHV